MDVLRQGGIHYLQEESLEPLSIQVTYFNVKFDLIPLPMSSRRSDSHERRQCEDGHQFSGAKGDDREEPRRRVDSGGGLQVSGLITCMMNFEAKGDD